MTRFINYFLKGLVFLAPFAVTIYVCVQVFSTIDGWLGIPIPGVGFLITVLLITLFGFLAQGFLTRSVFAALESLLARLPFVRLLYGATRDLLNAFVGEQRRFGRPVLVTPYPGGTTKVIGFVTQGSLASLGLADYVTVYLPFSYSFTGTLIIVPASSVVPLNADSADVLAFIVSGGVTTPPGTPNVPAAPILVAQARVHPESGD